MSGYALDNSWSQANRRLALLEHLLDPMTRRRMTMLGLGPGAHCLEVGAGGGSVARWLSAEVGAVGRVLATDINTALLDRLDAPNLETRVHDITADPLEEEFDFAHTRWLLHHLPDPLLAIRRMVEALKPGGWLLLEEVDFFPVHTSSSPLYRDFMVALTDTVVKASGRDCFWARALPEAVASLGLERVSGEGDFSVIQGGGPVAEFFSLTAEQMRERMVSSGAMSAERIDEALALLASPDFWAFGGGGIAMWGRKPLG